MNGCWCQGPVSLVTFALISVISNGKTSSTSGSRARAARMPARLRVASTRFSKFWKLKKTSTNLWIWRLVWMMSNELSSSLKGKVSTARKPDKWLPSWSKCWRHQVPRATSACRRAWKDSMDSISSQGLLLLLVPGQSDQPRKGGWETCTRLPELGVTSGRKNKLWI